MAISVSLDPLAGEYTTKITTDDVAKLNSLDPNISNNIGSWIISLKSDGTATAIYENRETTDINYTIDGNDMEIYIRNGICSENVGRYKWGLKGSELLFSKVADSCDSEVLVLTSHPLERANP